MPELEEQIKVVAEARGNAKAYSEEKSKIYEEVEEKHASLFADAFNASEIVKEEEAKLRELTLQAYADDPTNKQPAAGVGIKECKVLTYDGKVAFDWAKAHKMALKLDVSSFEKIAKADTPDFVKITTKATATIATELKVA